MYISMVVVGLWCLMPLSTIFQLYRGSMYISSNFKCLSLILKSNNSLCKAVLVYKSSHFPTTKVIMKICAVE